MEEHSEVRSTSGWDLKEGARHETQMTTKGWPLKSLICGMCLTSFSSVLRSISNSMSHKMHIKVRVLIIHIRFVVKSFTAILIAFETIHKVFWGKQLCNSAVSVMWLRICGYSSGAIKVWIKSVALEDKWDGNQRQWTMTPWQLARVNGLDVWRKS